MAGTISPRDTVVFFDVGGTLLEVSPSVGHVYAAACRKRGGTVAPESLQRAFDEAWVALSAGVPPGADRYRILPGGETAWWEQVSAHAFERCGVPAAQRPPVSELRAVFAGPDAWRIFPETRDALRELGRRGYRLGVLSNWDSRLPALLDTLDLRRHFEAVIHSAEAGFEKPHPAIFSAALDAFGVEAGQAIHVGDRVEEDYAGARAAGLRALLVRREEGGAVPGMPDLPGLSGRPSVDARHRVKDLHEVVRRVIDG